jgi:uncharacterized protein (DUF58 family)
LSGSLGSLLEVISNITAEGQAVLLVGAALAAGGAIVGGERGALAASLGLAIIAFILADGYLFAVRLGIASRLKGVRILPQPLVEGSPSKVRIELHNPSGLPLGPVMVEDNPPRHFILKSGASAWGYVGSRSAGSFSYTIIPRVGRHEWGKLRVTVRDPLGFYEGIVEVDAEPSIVKVYPRSLIPSRLLAVVRTASALGGAGARRRGVGTEFLELREYVPGDDFRLVDWKATARTGKLIVKVFEEEALPRVAVVVDASKSMFLTGCGGEAGIEYAARLAAALSELLARSGGLLRFSLLSWDGSRVATGWAGGRGVAIRVRSLLASAIKWPPTSAEPPYCNGERVPTLAFEVLESARPGSTVVLITDFCLNISIAKAFTDAIAGRFSKRAKLIVVIPPVGYGECVLRRAYLRRVAELVRPLGVDVYSGPIDRLVGRVLGFGRF